MLPTSSPNSSFRIAGDRPTGDIDGSDDIPTADGRIGRGGDSAAASRPTIDEARPCGCREKSCAGGAARGAINSDDQAASMPGKQYRLRKGSGVTGEAATNCDGSACGSGPAGVGGEGVWGTQAGVASRLLVSVAVETSAQRASSSKSSASTAADRNSSIFLMRAASETVAPRGASASSPAPPASQAWRRRSRSAY